MTTRELVAKIVYEKLGQPLVYRWEYLRAHQQEFYLEVADAVMAALEASPA